MLAMRGWSSHGPPTMDSRSRVTGMLHGSRAVAVVRTIGPVPSSLMFALMELIHGPPIPRHRHVARIACCDRRPNYRPRPSSLMFALMELIHGPPIPHHRHVARIACCGRRPNYRPRPRQPYVRSHGADQLMGHSYHGPLVGFFDAVLSPSSYITSV